MKAAQENFKNKKKIKKAPKSDELRDGTSGLNGVNKKTAYKQAQSSLVEKSERFEFCNSIFLAVLEWIFLLF